jgi:hypothetical protein
MGIMMSETCWDRSNKHLIVASCWFSLFIYWIWLLINIEFRLITGSVCLFALFCAVAVIVALIFVYPDAVCHKQWILISEHEIN